MLSMHVSRFAAAAALAISMSVSSSVHADFIVVKPIPVGSGFVSSFVQIDFLDGPTHVFEVFHDNNSTTGMDLLFTLDTELGDQFVLDYDTFGPDKFINTLGFDDIVQSNNVDAGQFWLYWVRENQSDLWASASVAATQRIVGNGTWDGWVFGGGFEDPPIAVKLIPAPPATLVLAGLLIVGRRRRRAV
jgi:hypothetical protein